MSREKFDNALAMMRAQKVKDKFPTGFLGWLVNEFAHTEGAKNKHYPSLLKEAIENSVAVASAGASEKRAFANALNALTITKTDGSVHIQGHVAALVVFLQAAQKVNTEELAKTPRTAKPH